MTLKSKIEKIIEAIKDTKITEIEISSLWGAQKIKLKQGGEDKQNSTILDEKKISNESNKDLDVNDQIAPVPTDRDESEESDNNYTIYRKVELTNDFSTSKSGLASQILDADSTETALYNLSLEEK